MADFEIERADALDGVPHGFFGHGGGQHQFGFGGPGEPHAVHNARAEAANAICAGAACVAPHQVHSPDVVTVECAWDDAPAGRPAGDAVVTAQRGIALGIVTADCAPVLFADRQAGVVGAAHAGWRGAYGGVLENTIAAMEALGATRSNITAAVGPTIAQTSYEVDAPFRANFSVVDEKHFAPAPIREGTARWYFDLSGYIAERLDSFGLANFAVLNRDTFSLSERYYSYRRAVQRGEPNYGRQISMIAIG